MLGPMANLISSADHAIIAAVPEWRNGRRYGLKNRWTKHPYGFESRLRHQHARYRIPHFSEEGAGFCF